MNKDTEKEIEDMQDILAVYRSDIMMHIQEMASVKYPDNQKSFLLERQRLLMEEIGFWNEMAMENLIKTCDGKGKKK